MNGMINISGIDKAKVLAALFNASKQQGMGFFDTSGATPMSLDDAAKHIDAVTDSDGEIYFDYLRGRVMKVELSGDELNPRLYDRDNGQGAAARALAGLVTKSN